MEQFVKEIKNYIIFLKKQFGLEITLHPQGDEQLISTSELLSFNIHENSYCVYVKSQPEAQTHCILKQQKVFKKCKEGAFCGSCWAGVKEYVYPILCDNNTVGFICVSGYKSKDSDTYIKRCAEKFNIPIKNLKKAYNSLKNEIPDKHYVDTLIIPLIRMLELAYDKSDIVRNEPALIDKILRYVNRYYTQNITLDNICSEFSCSRSCISHIFKKSTGKSFREYLTSVRLNAAKNLLKHSGLSITEIALSVGFSDSNYFSGVFKTHTGTSPRSYRNNFRQ